MPRKKHEMPNRKRTFVDIKVLADAACRDAYRKRTLAAFKNEPVNWADLTCHTVEWYESDTGTSGYRIYISEAAANCTNLSLYVANYLGERGYKDVDVVTEWI